MFHNPKMIFVAKTLTLLWFLAIFGQENYHWPTFGHVGFNQNYKMLPKVQKICSKSKKKLCTSTGLWPRVKISSKVIPLAKNMFGPRRKSISGVRIGLWPSFGHISRTWFFQKYQNFIKNTRFQKDFKNRLTAMKKCWPSGQIWWKSDAFGQHMFLWTRTGPLSYQTSRWPLLHTRKSWKAKMTSHSQ